MNSVLLGDVPQSFNGMTAPNELPPSVQVDTAPITSAAATGTAVVAVLSKSPSPSPSQVLEAAWRAKCVVLDLEANTVDTSSETSGTSTARMVNSISEDALLSNILSCMEEGGVAVDDVVSLSGRAVLLFADAVTKEKALQRLRCEGATKMKLHCRVVS